MNKTIEVTSSNMNSVTGSANTSSAVSNRLREHLRRNMVFYLMCSIILYIGLDPAESFGMFDVDAAGKAVTEPIQKAVNNYWPVGVFGLGAGGALVAQGDLRTRGMGFAMGALIAGLAMGAVKFGLGIH
jgi:hypothetical protein